MMLQTSTAFDIVGGMDLKTYLSSLPSDAARAEFSERCGRSLAYVRLVANGDRRCRESLAINIERESGAVVRVEDLRPDVDWAYLRGTAAAALQSTKDPV